MKKRCSCQNPVLPRKRPGKWTNVVDGNAERASMTKNRLDVVFFGDSIIEGWGGAAGGSTSDRKKGNVEVFKSLFTPEGGGKHKGLLLGVAADNTNNLLWRMQNGELPPSLNPRVFWLLIGTNNIGVKWCSPEATLIGILRVVQEIRERKPHSTIVINGILPRSFNTNGFTMQRKNATSMKTAIWNDIVTINKQLEEYSNEHDGIEYFDSKDIFLMRHGSLLDDDPQVDRNLMPDLLHPSPLGYKKWGEKISERLGNLIPKDTTSQKKRKM